MKKKIISSLIILMLFVSKSDAQPAGVPDTLAYLQTIVANKAQFIGQPFSVLLSHLQVQVKYFSPFGKIHHQKDKETSTGFGFYCPNAPNEAYKIFPLLSVSWYPYLSITTSDSLRTLYGCWASPISTYYSQAIVSDIHILN